MKIETNILTAVAVFLFLAAAVYGVWAQEPVGAVCLVLAGGLCGMIAAYFGFISRRLEPRPEDRKNAQPHEGAGVVGFFSPWSYWPVFVAFAVAVIAFALPFYAMWFVAIGVVMLIIGVAGWLFEYYVGL
jgi:hypothetical protein